MVSDKLKSVILRELQLERWDLDDQTTAGTVPGWDSLSHVALICAVEDAFKVRFRTSDLVRLRNLGELQALIDRALGGGGA